MAESAKISGVVAQNSGTSSGVASWVSGVLGIADASADVYNKFKGTSKSPASTPTAAPQVIQAGGQDNSKTFIYMGAALAAVLILMLFMRK